MVLTLDNRCRWTNKTAMIQPKSLWTRAVKSSGLKSNHVNRKHIIIEIHLLHTGFTKRVFENNFALHEISEKPCIVCLLSEAPHWLDSIVSIQVRPYTVTGPQDSQWDRVYIAPTEPATLSVFDNHWRWAKEGQLLSVVVPPPPLSFANRICMTHMVS